MTPQVLPLPLTLPALVVPPDGISLDYVQGGYRVVVRVTPVQSKKKPDVKERDCRSDLLTVVGEAGRITTTGILAELDKREWLHGESTVKRLLARMVKQGELLASRRAPRGYRLAHPRPKEPNP